MQYDGRAFASVGEGYWKIAERTIQLREQREAERRAKKEKRKAMTGLIVGVAAGALTGGLGLKLGLAGVAATASIGGQLGSSLATGNTAGVIQGGLAAAQFGGQAQSAYNTADMLNKMDDGSLMRQLNAGQEFTPAQVYGMQQWGGFATAQAALGLVATSNKIQIDTARKNNTMAYAAWNRELLVADDASDLETSPLYDITYAGAPARGRSQAALDGKLQIGQPLFDDSKVLLKEDLVRYHADAYDEPSSDTGLRSLAFNY